MSTAVVTTPISLPFAGSRVRTYFAPVNRVSKTPTLFDPAVNASFALDTPPAPWIDLGWIDEFTRSSQSVIAEAAAGSPSIARLQTRTSVGASVSFRFKRWSKLSMALAAGSQHMNVLAPASLVGTAVGSGAKAVPATALGTGSTATSLVPASSTGIQAGCMVVVDDDYATQTGFVGSGVSASYVSSTAAVGSDPDYIRRVSFNVAKVVSVTGSGALELATPLIAGVPASSAKVQQVLGFVDREGGTFFQEWSALFVVQGTQNDRLLLHYPRLQVCQSSEESWEQLSDPMSLIFLKGSFRALPVTDGNDGEQILSYRTYVPGPAANV